MTNKWKWLRWGVLGYILIMTVFLFVARGYTDDYSYISGDEPHYVMIADNILHYGNTNLKLSYDDNRSSLYYKGELLPHVSPVFDTKTSNEWYSIHTIGLPLLITVPYALGGLLGVRVFMVALQLSFILIFFLILKRYLKTPERYWFGTILLLVSPLYWQNVGAIMPDLIILTFAGFGVLMFGKKGLGAYMGLAVATLLAYMVHTKGLLLLGPIVAAKIIYDTRAIGFVVWLRRYWSAIVVAILGVGLYSAYLYTHYGSINPSSLYGANGQLFAASPFHNIVAAITDRSKGLLVFSPLLALVPLFAYRAVRMWSPKLKALKWKRLSSEGYLFAALAVGLTVLLVTQLGFTDWSGSTAPNGRYLLAFVVVGVVLVARFVNIRNLVEKAIVYALAGASLVVTLICTGIMFNYMSSGVNSFIVEKLHVLIYLPLFNANASSDGHNSLVRGVMVLLLILLGNLLLGYIFMHSYKLRVSRRNVYKEIAK